ncbi:MAG: PilN domain-containing protein [Candidatus Acidiferrales bacterium]
MIRTNLLGRPRPKVKRRVAITGALQIALILIPISLGLVLLAGDWYFTGRRIAELQRNIEEKKTEKARLAQVQQEVERFEKRKTELEGNIGIIRDLKENQSGPVRLLEAVHETVSMTETLWLTSIEEKGGTLEFKGLAGSVEAVANFMTNLSQSGFFQSVEIKDAVQKQQREGTSNYEFTLLVKFGAPPPAEGASPPAAAGGAD